MGHLIRTEHSIDAAIDWLDEVKPDWLWSVDTDTLNIANPNNCVLAQVFGPLIPEDAPHSSGFYWVFDRGYNGHHIDINTMAFDIISDDVSDEYDGYDDDDPEYTSEDLYAELNADWVAAIIGLREARA